MTASLQITATAPDPAILDLPWHIPLEDWPAENLAALPRGISRHVVRFVKLSGRVIAVKEIGESVAYREYELLRALSRIGVPSVEPVGVITGRQDSNGERLEAVLVTEHLQFSLPYRALFSQSLQPDTTGRLIDALTVLLVRLHLAGFYWGTCPCRTPCSAATRGPSRPTWWTRRPGTCTSGCRTASAATTWRSPGSTSSAS